MELHMDVLSSVNDFFYNATTGALTPNQTAKIAKDTARPGATPQEIAAQQEYLQDFLDDYWPARTPTGTLWDDLKGDPLGLGRAVDAGDREGNRDWTWAIVIVAAVLLLFFLVDAFFG
jgi:hypothetical protein